MCVCVYDSMSVRDVIVQCLLHTEATRTVLDIIRTGVDTVEHVLAAQSRSVAIHVSCCLCLFTNSK